MTAFKKPRHLLPAATLLAATFFLVSAVPHVVAPVVAPIAARSAAHPSGFDVVRAEIRLCEASGERTRDECIDEVEAKALIQHAEQLADAEARRGAVNRDDELAAAARPSRSRLQ